MSQPFGVKLMLAGVSKPWLSSSIGRSVSAVEGWVAGRSAPPPEVVAWLDRRIADMPPRLPAYVPKPPRRMG